MEACFRYSPTCILVDPEGLYISLFSGLSRVLAAIPFPSTVGIMEKFAFFLFTIVTKMSRAQTQT